MIYVRLIPALVVFGLAGAGIVVALARSRRFGRLEFLGLSYIVGFGAVGLVSVVVMMAGLRVGGGAPVILSVVGAGVLAWRRPRFLEAEPLRWSGVLAALVAGIALFGAVTVDSMGVDAEGFWSVKGRSIHRYGTFRNPDFTTEVRPQANPRYPLLVPSLYAWIWRATGSMEGRPIRLMMALLFVASLPVIYRALRERLPERLSSWLTAVYAWTPAFLRPTGGAVTGYADHPFALFFLIAAMEGVRWLKEGDRASASLSALALAFASQTKNEGGSLVVLALILIPIFGASARGRRGLAQGVLIPLPGLALFILWSIIKTSFIPTPTLDMELSMPSGMRILKFLDLLGSGLIRFVEWTLTWVMVGLLLLVRPPRLREPDSLPAWLGLGQLAAYVAAWTLRPGEPKVVVQHNLARLLLHLLPVFFIWAAGRLATIPGVYSANPENERDAG